MFGILLILSPCGVIFRHTYLSSLPEETRKAKLFFFAAGIGQLAPCWNRGELLGADYLVVISSGIAFSAFEYRMLVSSGKAAVVGISSWVPATMLMGEPVRQCMSAHLLLTAVCLDGQAIFQHTAHKL